MQTRLALLSVIVALTLTGRLAAEEPLIEEIRQLYYQAKAFQRSEVVLPASYIRLYDEGRSDLSAWVKKAGKPSEPAPLTQLDVYLERKAVSSAVLFETSPSGDWAQTTEYFFWRNGRTAFIYAELRTFSGGVIVERRYYYDPLGIERRALKTVRDLSTKKVVADAPGSYLDDPPGLYRTYGELLAGLGLDMEPELRR